jgi:hypothetical protein
MAVSGNSIDVNQFRIFRLPVHNIETKLILSVVLHRCGTGPVTSNGQQAQSDGKEGVRNTLEHQRVK